MTSKRSKRKTRRVWAGAVVASAAFGGWGADGGDVWSAENAPAVEFADSGKNVKNRENGETAKIGKLGRACEPLNPEAPGRLPKTLDGLRLAPDFGCFWGFSVDGNDYRTLFDVVEPTGAFDALTITLRSLPRFDGNAAAVAATRKAVEYAKERGVGAILDVDLRIARYDFEAARPELSQERIYFKELDLRTLGEADGRGELTFEAPNLNDHYAGARPFYVRGARFVKAWRYRKNADGAVEPGSVVDVSAAFDVPTTNAPLEKNRVDFVDATSRNRFVVPAETAALDGVKSEKTEDTVNGGDFLTVAVAFRYSCPDIFADETLALEKRLYEQYRDVPALGVAKDEWGFPPSFDRANRLDDFWYSEATRRAYSAAFGKNGAPVDLVDDLFLAFRAQAGREAERIAAVDRFNRLCAERVLEYEIQNYQTTKEIWGPDAFVGVHCTWFPFPNTLEMRKNGVMWWKAPRDFAQSDEYVPFCCRNSLAKATDSHWINMFYARQVPAYIFEHWTAAASGGRVHIHNIYPRDENSPQHPADNRLMPIVETGGVARIRSKIRTLSLISDAPLDAPVAVVFGRFGAMNPLRPGFGKVGVDLCDRFSTAGFPADLIPVDEMSSTTQTGEKRWKLSDDGYLQYGPQRYSALVLWGENDADAADFAALLELAGKNYRTKIERIKADATAAEKDALAAEIIAALKVANVEPQTPWKLDETAFSVPEERSSRPQLVSTSRFIDGTNVWIAAKENALGDPIALDGATVRLPDGKESTPISVDANGVFAVRFGANGTLEAVAAAELKSLKIGDLALNVPEAEIADDPVDVAIWRRPDGRLRGVFQRRENALPPSLEGVVDDWTFLKRER
ncbi:MAG: hypothetical protein J6K25_15350 [Thermoguttaceae bacterium]|nr:hypothetical protein [Thermoguttaceae bacterium]